jgi:hypothetical protein
LAATCPSARDVTQAQSVVLHQMDGFREDFLVHLLL